MFCCCFPLHLPVSTVAVQVCASVQLAVLVLAAGCGEEVRWGLLCAGMLFSVASSKNYNTCGLCVLLASLDVIQLLERLWTTGSWVAYLRIALLVWLIQCARRTYTALKLAHSMQVHDPKSLQKSPLC